MHKVVINTFQLKVDVVRLFQMEEVDETARIDIEGQVVLLVWESEVASHIQEQAERLWSAMIPARIVDSEVAEESFIKEITEYALANS